MPVTNTKQARIELSEGQYKTLANFFSAAARTRVPMVAIEETNIQGVVAVITNRGITMVDSAGATHDLGKGAVGGTSLGAA